jgi:hypothetical protein
VTGEGRDRGFDRQAKVGGGLGAILEGEKDGGNEVSGRPDPARSGTYEDSGGLTDFAIS